MDFEDEESCSHAYRNMHDAEIDGRSIKVDYAAERGAGGGGGGGRGGGGRGGGGRGAISFIRMLSVKGICYSNVVKSMVY